MQSVKELNKTPLYENHIINGANMVDFAGWSMPLNYKNGIAAEHLATRKDTGLFDISHMGRFKIKGNDSLSFLQHVLTSNVEALEIGESQYTIISDEEGSAIDDAYLYRFSGDYYLLVVNASNIEKDKKHLTDIALGFNDLNIIDITEDMSMMSLQGPRSKELLLSLMSSGNLPEPLRNKLSIIKIEGIEVLVARTGYTGEPIGFELFAKSKNAAYLWNIILSKKPALIGLGARDTLRLEAGLPLYGNELGKDIDGCNIPILASPTSIIAVSFSPLKGNYIGKKNLEKQHKALGNILKKNYILQEDLPKRIMFLELIDKGIARHGNRVYLNNKDIGYITSATVVPYWLPENTGNTRILKDISVTRSIAIALINSNLWEQDIVEVESRGRRLKAIIMPYLIRSEAPPYTYAITKEDILRKEDKEKTEGNYFASIEVLLKKAISNTEWRQKACINLIPSEMSPSRIVKLLSIMDPCARYAEHKKMKAFSNLEVFYYQGTKFISSVEKLLESELKKYLNCRQIETRVISGQMANTAVFSAMVDYINNTDRKSEPKRIPQVLNHHIIKGGHLSSQPMGALKDFVALDPKTEKPAVIDFPVLPENPYKIDIGKTKEVIERYRPKLIIFGKSMIIYKEPISEIRDFIKEMGLDSIIMYDMAHVLGLVGKYFQDPFIEGADIVTGSTHKTFFGPQRGIIGSDWFEPQLEFKLWETIESRTFPGSVSNHHLGTMLGLLAAIYEMNCYKDDYQKQVISNAKAFARALAECGLSVAGDPRDGYTETHQVLIEVGYSRGQEIAERLERNNIITNYQATSEEEGFTASGAIRMGVSEMTRFGMKEEDFHSLAGLISKVVKENKGVDKEIEDLRSRFLDMRYCFEDSRLDSILENINKNV